MPTIPPVPMRGTPIQDRPSPWRGTVEKVVDQPSAFEPEPIERVFDGAAQATQSLPTCETEPYASPAGA